ncbi:MAG: Elongation factor Ts [Candidatus Woesebacteria bacterium GW2011_GWC2_47_16]|uniref:Elongation factor Ts n=9 Tax=Candidatus Woeseibacteriota TaxID=1752722 RepID=A0A0G1TNT7_9BACT|nr:MAG: Elongation factor Ts [Candidatus Woesebacteria bacterium GW2011_GWE1_45_18]KKU25251.1 MAG: Elongation factor Ts [Candidatus Woesebacteria bacterium GW2011_GWF1_46_13]KKU47030.1 MAG: Elongation factor Ts [Candidatus Woesebacteria bacterium GW2011_GWF2_46_8]KKU65234.1 MAG: Elongation factor Ts [Candidatus Woesebacteria bacterium GW2011_GWC2_47_16]KKU71058.1 MAG: Elongation factor Ts [Candidatus Woesebacteria bacterium GW2011_GWD1_47_21]
MKVPLGPMNNLVDKIRRLREESGAPVIRVKKVLEEVGGDEKKALAILQKEGFEKAEKRAERATSQGLVTTYSHHSGKIVSVVELLCETDFVARNELFKNLAHELALQVASLGAKDAGELVEQEFIKDPSKKVGDLVREVIAKTGENVRVGRIFRVELGK